MTIVQARSLSSSEMRLLGNNVGPSIRRDRMRQKAKTRAFDIIEPDEQAVPIGVIIRALKSTNEGALLTC